MNIPPPDFDGEARITLGLLNAVQDGTAATQRSMANDLGIALGLANAYVKRCVSKGYIKVRQIPRNRYSYYLTPQGFAEKSRLTARFLSQSFSLFREARQQYAALLDICTERGWSRVAFYGAGSLAEIAEIYASSGRFQIIGIIDSRAEASTDGRIAVFHDISAIEPVEAVLITDLHDPQAAYDTVAAIFPKYRILVPQLLHVSPSVRPIDEASR